MTWTRLDENHADRADLLAVSRSARHLHTEALIYGNRQGNNGRFRRTIVARMTDAEDWSELVDELVGAGIWEAEDDGWLQIDWAKWKQERSEVVDARKEAHAENQARYNERGRRHKAGDHSMCTNRCPVVRRSQDESRGQSGESSRDRSTDVRPIRSNPTPREDRRGESRSAGSAGAPPAAGTGEEDPRLTAQRTVHEFDYDSCPEYSLEDGLPPGIPCPTCGLNENDLVHWAHDFVGNGDHCTECMERPENPVHHWHLEQASA